LGSRDRLGLSSGKEIYMKTALVLVLCTLALAACQSNQSSGGGGLSKCVSTGAGGTTDVICP